MTDSPTFAHFRAVTAVAVLELTEQLNTAPILHDADVLAALYALCLKLSLRHAATAIRDVQVHLGYVNSRYD